MLKREADHETRRSLEMRRNIRELDVQVPLNDDLGPRCISGGTLYLVLVRIQRSFAQVFRALLDAVLYWQAKMNDADTIFGNDFAATPCCVEARECDVVFC